MSTIAPSELFPALDDATEAALRASIERFGVIVPVVVDQHGELLDGRHRARIARDLGVEYETQMREVADADEAREIARTLNSDRRHLSLEQRREVVVALREDGHSQRAIANALGVSRKAVRNDLDKVGPLAHVPNGVTGLDGKSYPATRTNSDNFGPKKREINEAAAARKLSTALGGIEGFCRGVADFDVSLAVAGGSPDEIKFWIRAAHEGASVLSGLKRALKEAQHEG